MEKGKQASEMSVKELRELVVGLKLLLPQEAKDLKKSELLLVVSRFEEEALATKETGTTGTTGTTVTGTPESDLLFPTTGSSDYFNGKKVITRSLVSLNGKDYEDILVETGETFRVLVK